MKASSTPSPAFFERDGRFAALVLFVLATFGLVPTLFAQATFGSAVPSRITEAVNPNLRVTLLGSTPAFAQPRYDQGALPNDTPVNHMLLVFKRSDAQNAALKTLLDQQQASSSSSYHRWLTPSQFGSEFGPSDADIATVSAWLQQSGFTVNQVTAGKIAVDFSGTAGQVNSVFHTELDTYQRNGVTFHSNNQDPQIPAAIAPVVSGFESLNDIKPKSNMQVLGTANMNVKTHTGQGEWDYVAQCFSKGQFIPCTLYIPTPADIAVQYNLNPVYKAGTTGKGVTIGVISASNLDLSVVQNYRTLFGLDPTNLPQVVVDGADPGQNGAATEVYLDVEASSSTAPDATTDVYVSADTLTTTGLVTGIIRAVDDDTADILTLSYAECEQQLGPSGNQFFNSIWEQAAAQGQSVFVSAGDAGSAGCDDFDTEAFATLGLAVNGFASTPYNTAVGGTDFYYPQYALGQFSPVLQATLTEDWDGTAGATSVNPTASLSAPLAEQPWNTAFGLNINKDTQGQSIVAGSGGISSCTTGTNVDPTTGEYGTCTGGYAKPSWQTAPGVPADGVRDVPDVSLFASNGANLSFWPVCDGPYVCVAAATSPGFSVSITAVGGTSASSPAMAGIMALVDETEKGRQGNANYTLYALANQFPDAFNDVTQGSNNVACTPGTPNCSADPDGDGFNSLQLYSAGPGYDLASGLGTINGANLIAYWSKVTFNASPQKSTTTLFLSEHSFAHGTPISVGVAVQGASGIPTGSVALVTTSTTPGQTGQGAIPLTSGTGSETTSALPGGTYTVSAAYPGDTVFGASTSAGISLTVSAEPSTLTLSGQATDILGNLTPLANGLSLATTDVIELEATVKPQSGSGLATGVVTFSDGSTKLGTGNINSNNEAILVTGLLPGTHSITASYSGDPSFTASSSGSISLTSTKAAPEISIETTQLLQFSPSYERYSYVGQPVNITALIISGSPHSPAPSGTATISLGSLPAQTVTLSTVTQGTPVGEGTATFTPTIPGVYAINVRYPGDANFSGVQSSPASPETLTIVAPTLAATTTTLTSTSTSVTPDGILQVNATVTGSKAGIVPTGSIYFYVGFDILVVTLDSNGQASVAIAGDDMANGVNNIYAQYQGDSVYTASVSSTLAINDNQGDFSLTASSPSLALTSTGTATTQLTVADLNLLSAGGLGGAVNFTCTTSSPAIACSFNPASITLPSNGSQASTALTLSAAATTASAANVKGGAGPMGRELAGSGIALAGMLLLIPARRRRLLQMLILLVITGAALGITGCGGSSSKTPTPTPVAGAPAGTYTVSVLANASGVQHSLALKVTVQ